MYIYIIIYIYIPQQTLVCWQKMVSHLWFQTGTKSTPLSARNLRVGHGRAFSKVVKWYCMGHIIGVPHPSGQSVSCFILGIQSVGYRHTGIRATHLDDSGNSSDLYSTFWKNHFTAVNWWISMGPCPSATCHSICSWGSGRRCKALPTFPDRVGCSRIRSLAFRACWMTAQSLGKLGNLRHLRPKLAAKGGNHDFSAWNGQVWMAIHQFQRTEKDDTYKRKDCSFTLVPLTWKICSSLPPGISTKCQWFILAFVNDKSHPNINTPGFRMWFHPLNSSTPRFLGGV